MNKFLVGFSKADITPKKPVQLTGYGNDLLRLSNNVLDPLYATCIAFTDENGETVLLFTLDLLYGAHWMRPKLSEALGIPASNIQVAATHTHAGPYVWLWEGTPPEAREYLETTLIDGMIEAAKKALESRLPAEMYINSTKTSGMNFIRRYYMEDGTYAGHHYGNFNQRIVGHESDPDSSLQLIKFKREGGKDIILANFSVHPRITGEVDKFDISADIIGAMRAKMEFKLNCHFAYFTGAAGNLDADSRIEAEHFYDDHIEHGRALADYALKVNDSYKKVETGNVKIKCLKLDLETDHSLDYLEETARKLVDEWKKTGDKERCDKLCFEKGLHSVYHAESVLDKLILGKTMAIEICALSIGDVAFTMMPYEIFDNNGMYIKENSPYKMTFIASCANTVSSYIPSKIAFEHGGYCVDRCRLIPGTAEKLSEEYVEILKRLHK